VDNRPAREWPRNLVARALALLEVLLAFAFVHFCYRSFKQFTTLGRSEVAAGLNFSPGATMILFTVVILLLCRRSFEDYGLTLKDWHSNLSVGLFWGLLIVVVAGLVVKLARLPFDPVHPPDWPRALAWSAGTMVLTLLLLLSLWNRNERSLLLRVPAPVSLLILAGLLALPLVLAALSQRPLPLHLSVPGVLLSVLWLFFGAGFGEEVFFRGYVQSRVNQAFGRPFRLRFLGLEFGPGLIVASLLFGFIHALNTVDYFTGRLDFAWLWCVTNFFTGLFLGCLREKTGSILPGAIVHGLGDVLALVPGLLPA
jgi:membrane protease YdiL (CAAX protease family)